MMTDEEMIEHCLQLSAAEFRAEAIRAIQPSDRIELCNMARHAEEIAAERSDVRLHGDTLRGRLRRAWHVVTGRRY